jgi:hypothetical protein
VEIFKVFVDFIPGSRQYSSRNEEYAIKIAVAQSVFYFSKPVDTARTES